MQICVLRAVCTTSSVNICSTQKALDIQVTLTNQFKTLNHFLTTFDSAKEY
jgi:hypothetical protein